MEDSAYSRTADLVSTAQNATFEVELYVSEDGQNFVQATSVTGDVGPGVMPGASKRITWRWTDHLESLAPAIDQFQFQVRTEVAQLTPPAAAVDEGGINPLVWVGIAAGGAAGALAVLSGGGDPNSPPAAAFSISPAGTGMARQTTFSFNASASTDPDGNSLDFSWDFGDGTTGTGSPVTHVFDSPGMFMVTLTVSDGEREATTTGSVTVNPDLSDTWTGTAGGDDVTLMIRQDKEFFDGPFVFRNPGGSFPGVIRDGHIDGSNNYVCPCDVTIPFDFDAFGTTTCDGNVNASVTTISCTMTGLGFGGEVLTVNRP